MLIAKINPVQFIVINKAVIDNMLIFLYDLKIKKKSLIFPMQHIIINKNIKDHKPRWKAISTDGINLISLKKRGWGIPQNKDAKQVYKIPL